MRIPLPSFVLLCALSASAAPAALAQDHPQAPSATAELSLDDHYGRVIGDATLLCDRYKKAIAEKVDALCAQSAGLQRLREAGIFTLDTMLAPVPFDDPLAALPALRTAYYSVEEVAESKAKEFAGMIKTKNEEAAIAMLKKIAKAQQLFWEEDRDGNGISDYTEKLSNLTMAGLQIDGVGKMDGTNEATINGYRFRIILADPRHWAGDAQPVRPGATGDRFFYIDETGLIRSERGRQAGSQSEPVK